MSLRQPNILRLPLASLESYLSVEDLFDAQLLERRPEQPRPPSPVFDSIPRVFSSVEAWPSSTNLECWHSGFTFDGPPRFIPTHIIEKEDGTVELGTMGNFMTFNHAAGWIMARKHGEEQWRALGLLAHAYQLVTGEKVSHIPPAPGRERLRRCGGDLSDEEYWALVRRLDPKFGLKDHTPGSVIPDRARIAADVKSATSSTPRGKMPNDAGKSSADDAKKMPNDAGKSSVDAKKMPATAADAKKMPNDAGKSSADAKKMPATAADAKKLPATATDTKKTTSTAADAKKMPATAADAKKTTSTAADAKKMSAADKKTLSGEANLVAPFTGETAVPQKTMWDVVRTAKTPRKL